MQDGSQSIPPDTRKAELALALAKAAASLIPFGGGTATEILGAIIAPSIEARKTAWLESLAASLYDLSQQVADLTPERLAQDEAFTTAFLRASQGAVRTHQIEKAEALRNVVLNVAVGMAPDENLQLMFLDAVDDLTPWHLNLLGCVADPIAWAERHQYWVELTHAPDAAVIFEAFYRDQVPAKEFVPQLLQDLFNRSFITNKIDVHGPVVIHDFEDASPHISEMGRLFLAFITEPRVHPANQNREQVASEGKP